MLLFLVLKLIIHLNAKVNTDNSLNIASSAMGFSTPVNCGEFKFLESSAPRDFAARANRILFVDDETSGTRPVESNIRPAKLYAAVV